MSSVTARAPSAAAPANPPQAAGTTGDAGVTKDPALGRTFPCEACGAKLEFHIGQQSLKCPYCGAAKALEIPEGTEVKEQDLGGAIRKQVELRQKQGAPPSTTEVKCGSCGGTTAFQGTLTSSECPYCGSPLQRADVHQSPVRVPVDGVLPFLVDREKAAANLRTWVGSRWFAPDEFKRRGADGVFSGIYLPYWTYDAMTATRYSGQRGEAYYVTVGTGKDQRRERRVNWFPASGFFQRFFDDVMVCASSGMPNKLLRELEPWPMAKVIPFTPDAMSGYLARTYDVEIEAGMVVAKHRMTVALEREVQQRIGGDEQRVQSITTQHFGLTYKHLLLPVWLLAYRFGGKPFQVAINAATGEVQGERPYSWIKITLAILAVVAAVAAAIVASNVNRAS